MFLSPKEAFEDYKNKYITALEQQFPVKGKKNVLELQRVEVTDSLSPDDVHTQKEAKETGATWGESVFGHFVLKDNMGTVLDKKRVRMAVLPRMTNRFSYIVGGQEHQVDSQWQLRPGAYARRNRTGELEVQFNSQKGKAFEVQLDPESKVFKMVWNSSKLPLYPILKNLGVSDAELEHTWGKETLESNKSIRGMSTVLERAFKSDTGRAPFSHEEAAGYVRNILESSVVDPGVTEVTLGKAFHNVSGDALRRSTARLLDINRGGAEDDRDSLVFKKLRNIGDFTQDKMRGTRVSLQNKMLRKIDTAGSVRDIIKFPHFMEHVEKTFTKNQAIRLPSQINPLEMISSAMQTTVMGEGGIKSDFGIVDETKAINPSHFGILDPVNTPEGSRSGVTLRLALGMKVKDGVPHSSLYNPKTDKIEDVSLSEMLRKNIGIPDQYTWKNGKPEPIKNKIYYMGKDNKLEEGAADKVDYILRYPAQALNLTSNMIPFMHSLQGNRSGMATRHIEQAVSLVEREAPLVKSGTGFSSGEKTFESLAGKIIATTSPIDGEVKSVTGKFITIQGASGEVQKLPLYDHFGVTDAKSFLHSFPLVKAGDKVSKGQVVADNNYTKNGELALGRNLRVAYIPYKGLSFEDGVVLSQTAANKLASLHLTKTEHRLPDGAITSPDRFGALHSGTFTKTQLGQLGEDGVVKVGTRVKPGDPLVLTSVPYDSRIRSGLAVWRKNVKNVHTDKSLVWDSDFEGEVVGSRKNGNKIYVDVKTVEPIQIADKVSNRSAAKGVVTRVVPDDEMPKDKQGNHIEMCINPAGLPGRINPSQIYETIGGKIAKKTGKPYIVENFTPNVDQHKAILEDAKKHGVSDTEELFDPITGLSLGHVTVGHQHVMKLVHQVEKKGAVRSGMVLPGGEGESYNINLQPGRGGHTGGQSLGALGVYALLAHGSTEFLREAQTWKSEGMEPETWKPGKLPWKSQHRDVWESIQLGLPLPTPAPTFAFHKFESYLKAAGVNMEKKGHKFVLSPLTNDQILKMSSGALPNPEMVVQYKEDELGNPTPYKGGLYDPKLTGGHGGKNWTHIALSEPMPNPMFEKPIRALTGLKGADYLDIIYGRKAVLQSGKLTDDTKLGVTGGKGIEKLLSSIDIKKELVETKKLIDKTPVHRVDKLVKKAKYLEALDRMGMRPEDAYVLKNLPIMPPIMRPTTFNERGNIEEADINRLYKTFGEVNKKLGSETYRENVTDKYLEGPRKSLYDGLKAILGVGVKYEDQEQKGLLHQISGSAAKAGFFQKTLGNKRQDLSMRSVITPGVDLAIDEMGVPEHYAMNLFAPFVVKHMVTMGMARHPYEAQEMIAKKDPLSKKALIEVMKDRPIVAKRDPALHKYSVQGFQPVLVPGKAIHIHPLVVGGFGADFDGDTMSIFVPISETAKQEVNKMKPSNNLFALASGRLAYMTKHEATTGLFRLSEVGQDSGKSAKSYAEAVKMAVDGKVKATDLISVSGVKTTPGRVLLASVLPEDKQKKVLEDHSFLLNKKNLDELMTQVAKTHKGEFATVINRLKDIGYGASYGAIPLPRTDYTAEMLDPKKTVHMPFKAMTATLKDLTPDREVRDKAFAEAQLRVNAIEADPHKTRGQKDEAIIATWSKAEKKIKDEHTGKMHVEAGNNIVDMYRSGEKPKWEQYKQLKLSPVLVTDSQGVTLTTPIKKSYSEGLSLPEYWIGMYGARRGLVRKVQEVQKPGVLTKALQNVAMDRLIASHDCGTTSGISLSVGDPAVQDRYLAKDFSDGKVHFPAGTLVTPDVTSAIQSAKKDAVLIVRSPIKCQHEKGICQKCYGLIAGGDVPPMGMNVGVISAHSLGERTTQLMLKEFHCLHKHTLVKVREGTVVRHSTIGKVVEAICSGRTLEVWDNTDWTKILGVVEHPQHPETSMVITRTQSGNFVVSQDNHPHMVAPTNWYCPVCGTYPRSSKGKTFCKKCHRKFDTRIVQAAIEVEPREMREKAYDAVLSSGPEVSEATPPLASGWLAGMYCAEGSVGCPKNRSYDGTKPVFISIGQSPSSVFYDEIFEELVKEHGLYVRKASKELVVHSVELASEYMQTFGRYSRNKGLPEGWSGYPKEWLADFISGMIDGDGTVSTCEDSAGLLVCIDTTSILLAQQVHWILRHVGISAHTYITPVRKNTAHQGLAIKFILTEHAASVLSRSGKLKGFVPVVKTKEDSYPNNINYIKPFFFEEAPVVYDLTTESGTFTANGIWTHNTGGVTGGTKSVSGDFDFLAKLMNMHPFPNQAVLAKETGEIEEVKRTPTGTVVSIKGKEHFVGNDKHGVSLTEIPDWASDQPGYERWNPPKKGMTIKAGQPLSDPNRTVVHPLDLYKATNSLDAFQSKLTAQLDHMFRAEGVDRRHAEVVVKAMSDTTKITDPGDMPGLMKGELRNTTWVKNRNAELAKEGRGVIQHEPFLRGVDVLPLSMRDDWMAKLQHQRLRGTIMDAAATGAVSDLHGFHPIPGLAYGAEFGMTQEHSKQPGLGHLKDVPKGRY